MKITAPLLLLFSLLFTGALSSCKEDEPLAPKESEFLILNGDAAIIDNNDWGGISTYSYPSENKKSANPEYEATMSYDKYMADAVIHDGFAYVTTRFAGDLVKVSLSDFKVAGFTKMYYDGYTHADKTVELYNNQLIIGYSRRVNSDYGADVSDVAYLKFFDINSLHQTDSVAVAENHHILDMESVGNMLYISLLQPYSTTAKLLKFNLQTRQATLETSWPKAPAHLMASSRGELYALAYGHLWKVDPQSLEVLAHDNLYAVVNNKSSASSFALNEEEEILYYFKEAAQPAPFPYLLASFNLKTKEDRYLTAFDGPAISSAMISFDKARREIVVASYNKLLFFDKEGKYLRSTELDFGISKMLPY